MRYIKQLDSLRALAVIQVIIVHWFPHTSAIYQIVKVIYVPSFFFTLSGFLITGILLKEKIKAENTNSNKFISFKNFFFRRALRIFPAYFLLITIVYFTKPITEYLEFKYYVFFGANFHIYEIKTWPMLAHLWSMSVEEQFYFIWPLLILLNSKRVILFIIMLLITGGILYQGLMPRDSFSDILTINCLPSLSIGALLSWMIVIKPHVITKYYKFISIIALACVVLYGINLYIFLTEFIQYSTLISVVTFWIITFFWTGRDKKPYLFSFLLENERMMQLGKISYGLYLFHFVIPYYTGIFVNINNKLKLPDEIYGGNYIFIGENFLLLILISFCSYKYFELPFLTLKKYFSSSKDSQPALNSNTVSKL